MATNPEDFGIPLCKIPPVAIEYDVGSTHSISSNPKRTSQRFSKYQLKIQCQGKARHFVCTALQCLTNILAGCIKIPCRKFAIYLYRVTPPLGSASSIFFIVHHSARFRVDLMPLEVNVSLLTGCNFLRERDFFTSSTLSSTSFLCFLSISLIVSAHFIFS